MKNLSSQPVIITLFLMIAYVLWASEPGGRVYWPFIITGYIIALIIYHDRGIGLKESLADFFSKKVWFHPTMLNECILIILMFFVSYQVLDRIHFLSPDFFNSQSVHLLEWMGFKKSTGEPTLAASIAYIIANFLAYDLGYYLAHTLMHKSKFLWEFHKVHHSAQVMTPVTSLRQHPVELILNRFIRLSSVAVVGGIFFMFYPYVPTLTVIASTNAALFVFLFLGSTLAHSHIWVSFGKLENFFVSPAMHQIHHSDNPKHFDKNMGLSLSIWDRMFGTAHLTPEFEEIHFGLGEKENKEFLTLPQLIWSPFVRAFKGLFGRRAAL